MNNDLFNILANNSNIDTQKLIDYLNDKLSYKERNEVERWITDNEIANDAVEGLQQLKNKKNLQAYVDQLNKNLQNQLQQKKQRNQKRRIKEYPWIYFTIIAILVLCIIAYLVIRNTLH